MPRRLQQSFKCSPLQELTRQLLFAPAPKRVEQVHRAERLHDEIDADTPYPFEYLVYRITGYRRKQSDDESVLLVGEAVQPDLRLMIDQLSQSVNLGEDDESAQTVQQIAEQLNVSTRTVNRWRKIGLRWRWVTPTDRPPHIVITDQALSRFSEQHAQRVVRASQFTPVAPQVREQILARARDWVASSDTAPSLNHTAAHLAEESGRALETVRLILEKHDRAHPDHAIFTQHTGPLTPRQKRVIERAYRMGVATSKLAMHFGRSRYTIHRVIRERRAAAAQQADLRHVYWPTFDREDAEEVFLRPQDAAHALPDENENGKGNGSGQQHIFAEPPSSDLPAPLADLYRQRILSPSHERSLFIRYNYLKYRAQQVREHFHHDEPRVAELDRFDALLEEARRSRKQLVKANLRVVLSVARRHLIGYAHAGSSRLFELLETGHELLFDAVDQYNAAWSHPFESYLTNRLLTYYAQTTSTSEENGQARRRLSPEQIRDRLLAHAQAHGIDLCEERRTELPAHAHENVS